MLFVGLSCTQSKYVSCPDIAVFCANRKSVSEVIAIAKRFCRSSGSAVNWDTCLGFWHGNWDVTPSLYKNVKWVSSPVNYLGVPLENYRDSEPYWQRQIIALRDKSEKWRGKDLSVFTRAAVCNLFFVSKLWYVLQALHCLRLNVHKLPRVFAVFIWGSSY